MSFAFTVFLPSAIVIPFLPPFLNSDYKLYRPGYGVTKFLFERSILFPYPREVVLLVLVVGKS